MSTAALDKLFEQVYTDALTTGIGLFSVRPVLDAMQFKRVPTEDIFRWKLLPLPGYSHAHSRKIRRERRRREPITIRNIRVTYDLA